MTEHITQSMERGPKAPLPRDCSCLPPRQLHSNWQPPQKTRRLNITAVWNLDTTCAIRGTCAQFFLKTNAALAFLTRTHTPVLTVTAKRWKAAPLKTATLCTTEKNRSVRSRQQPARTAAAQLSCFSPGVKAWADGSNAFSEVDNHWTERLLLKGKIIHCMRMPAFASPLPAGSGADRTWGWGERGVCPPAVGSNMPPLQHNTDVITTSKVHVTVRPTTWPTCYSLHQTGRNLEGSQPVRAVIAPKGPKLCSGFLKFCSNWINHRCTNCNKLAVEFKEWTPLHMIIVKERKELRTGGCIT